MPGRDSARRTTHGETEHDGSPPPGPGVLYDSPVTAPQFENGSGWCADPLLVCGTVGYDAGEFLYQDWLYDDHGANTTDETLPPNPQPQANILSAPTGDVVYPTETGTYRDNAADLLEFRCRREEKQVLYRLTFNTMTEPDAAVTAIGIDTGGATRTDWEHGLGDLGAPVTHVLLVAGDRAVLDGPDGEVRSVNVDERRQQIEIGIDLRPGEETWTHYCVTGIHDGGLGFAPLADQPTDTRPGGKHGTDAPPAFNVAFRERAAEPMSGIGDRSEDAEDEQASAGSRATMGYGAVREHAQAKALAARDISEFGAEIDFGKLRRRITDRRVPDTGYMNRLYASRYTFGEGIVRGANRLAGRVQPYTVYVPESYDGSPAPMYLYLHGRTSSYNELGVFMPNQLRELGEERDAIVLAVEARGPEELYRDGGEIDVYEAWSDLRSRYAVDDDRVSIGGYSMGGYGMFKLAAQFPDLFAKGFSIVGAAGRLSEGPSDDVPGFLKGYQNGIPLFENLRHVPILMWNGVADETVPISQAYEVQQRLQELDYPHRLDEFPDYEHLTFSQRDQWGPAREFLDGEFLGDPSVERAPARVTYRAVPQYDRPDLGLVHDGAYWVSDIEVGEAPLGEVDAISYARDDGDRATEGTEEGTESAPDRHGMEWFDPTSRNALSLETTDVTEVTVWVAEAGLDADREIEVGVSTNVATTVRLATPDSVVSAEMPSGTHEIVVSTRKANSGNRSDRTP